MTLDFSAYRLQFSQSRPLPERREQPPAGRAGLQSHPSQHVPPPVGQGPRPLHQAPEPRLQAEVPRQVRQGGEQQEVHSVHEGGRGGLGQDQPENCRGIQAGERANKSKDTSKTLSTEDELFEAVFRILSFIGNRKYIFV